MSSQPAATKSPGQAIVAYFKDFGMLKETGTEYWGIQIVNFLDCTFYFAMLRHNPAAMWLVLGAYALGGCVIAAFLRGWLTQGAHWKAEKTGAY